MTTLLFNESPILFVIVSVIFGIIDFIFRRTNIMHPKHTFIIYVVVIALFMYFYRVPTRFNTYPNNLMVSPCDGKVMSILRINSSTTHIAIYLNLLDAHVQWCPVSGEVLSIVRKQGRFNPAYMLNKSKYNERVETMIYVPFIDDNIKLVQIAGQLCRRIVTYINEEEEFDRGDLFGMIKFGSRVDLFVPHHKVKLLIHVGDRVIGNKTIIGKLLR
jgi:phosphatidylserine decarboxylase